MGIGIISWIVVGLIAGVLAKLIMPGRDPGGFLLTIVIGMIGALVGRLTQTWPLVKYEFRRFMGRRVQVTNSLNGHSHDN
jgi:uncharacterized membrane protein YeaQ/YmgE (transglycosylase-associated protein family)